MILELKPEQRFTLGVLMQQSMNYLQMNAQELEACLHEMAMENPLLEEQPPEVGRECPLYIPSAGKRAENADAPSETFLRPKFMYESLAGSVREQIAALRIPEPLRRDVFYLAGELDDRGFLSSDAEQLPYFRGARGAFAKAVELLQSLEPAGVGARNLGECLCLQLKRIGCADELPYAICERYIDRLGKGQLNHIATALKVPLSKVVQAKTLIASLEPNPSNGFDNGEKIAYVTPDIIIITEQNGTLRAATADRYAPVYGVDAYYASLLRDEHLGDSERAYLEDKLRQVKWAIYCVTRRKETLLSCAGAILEFQRDFFTDGKSPLRPLTMMQLAERLGVHTSTVSRAVRGKYLICRWGTFPLSDFFSQQVDKEEGASSSQVLTKIKDIIAAENPYRPLSDKTISEALGRSGIRVARRTVTKYRESAMIPSSACRRARR